MLTFLKRLFLVLLPLLGFALLLAFPVRELMGQVGNGPLAIGVFLGGLAALALAEGLIFRFMLLPRLGEAIGESVYGGTYVPEEDALVRMVARVRESRDSSLLPELRALVLAQPCRVRGWQELARVQQDVCEDPKGALETLLEGESRLRDKEERAMLLVRAAQLCESVLHDPQRAQSYYNLAAEKFPRTVYGRKAAERDK